MTVTTTFNFPAFQCIEMAVFDSSTFSGGSTYDIMNGPSSYSIFTGTGFQSDIKILQFYNGSTVGVTLSFGQIVDPPAPANGSVKNIRHLFLPASGTLIIDLQTNHSCESAYASGTLNGRKGQIVWGNATAGTGNIYISGYR